MVHTRGQGARPEGFSEYQPAKREKTTHPITSATQGPLTVDRAARAAGDPLIIIPDGSDTSSDTDVEIEYMAALLEKSRGPKPKPKSNYQTASTQTSPEYRDASTQKDPELTCTCQCHLVPTSAKRRREVDEDTDRTVPKRRKAVTPDRSTFLFSKTRNRSILTSAPPKLNSRNESLYFGRAVEPPSPESSPTAIAPQPSSHEKRRPQRSQQLQPETPVRNPAPPRGLFGSVRKMFGYLTGGGARAAENEGQPQQRNPETQEVEAVDVEGEEEFVNEGSPTPTQRRISHEHESPPPESETLDSRIFTREHFKRRRTANTIAGREQMAAMNEAEFQPAQNPGSNKRKLASVDGYVPGPKRGGFGIDDSYLDCENEIEGIGESSLNDTPQPATPTNRRPPQTPLRSALRQTTGNQLGTFGRSAKSVRINSVPTSAKAVYGQYGPAGDYRGSTFADISSHASTESPSTILKWDTQKMHSPDTLKNTRNNTPHRFDPTVTDPTDRSWRPSAANPKPGQFVLPDYDDEEYDEEEGGQEGVPTQPPSTPRMSHAELPQGSPSEHSGLTGHTDSMTGNDTQEVRLNKARSDAQKYKPAKSSRLSLSEQARSRSSSPPGVDSTFRESQLETGTPDHLRPRSATTPLSPEDSSMRTASSLDSPSRAELDNWTVGEDGMTDYQREHQYDSWAEDIFANIPSQTYSEAGIASSFVDNLVQKTWTERDTRESAEFWEREFEEGLKAARQAEEEGGSLVWITDPDEIIELEQAVY